MLKKFYGFINEYILQLSIFYFVIFSVVIFVSDNFFVIMLCGFLYLAIIFIYKKSSEFKVMELCEQLSDMLDKVIATNQVEEQNSLDLKDTLISKLSFQMNKLTNILLAKNKKMKEDKEEVQKLVSDIAHQLKIPIANVKMYGELLDDNNLTDEERKKYYKILITYLHKLEFLIESLIKMTRLESGVIQLYTKEYLLNEIIIDGIGGINSLCKQKNINVVYNKVDNVYCKVDYKWMLEAVTNILENAVKYSFHNSEILVTVQRYELFSRVDITNEGVTIMEEDYGKIFKRFYRSLNALDEEGIGIGLYLSEKIIGMHEGFIKVKCEKNWVTFSLFVPVINIRN